MSSTDPRPHVWETVPLRYVCELNPSVAFDGFDEDELYIFTENLEPEDENPYSSLFFNVILDNEDSFKIKIKSNKDL